jgi:hypothetical protein
MEDTTGHEYTIDIDGNIWCEECDRLSEDTYSHLSPWTLFNFDVRPHFRYTEREYQQLQKDMALYQVKMEQLEYAEKLKKAAEEVPDWEWETYE